MTLSRALRVDNIEPSLGLGLRANGRASNICANLDNGNKTAT